ncbi:MAG: glycerophosphodiester phosphodiesterase [Candidatus Marinimicrobia bacterium]|nr:glycerophosphodiester phosphodiesterase [Candidatus Neomarinimicrobiota bacterium]
MKKIQVSIFFVLVFLMVSCAVRTLDVQGHRGARGLRPENTLAGFEYAIVLGVTTLELDIGISADGVVIVTHNPSIHGDLCLNLDGTQISTDSLGHGPLIRDLTLDKIKEYDCGSLNPEQARFSEPPRVNIPGEKMPTLKEVFDLIRKKENDVSLNIEMKVDPRYNVTISDSEFVKIVVGFIRREGMTHKVHLQSFNWRTLEMVKKIAPEIRTAALLGTGSYEPVNDTVPSPWLNEIHFYNTDGTALGILKEAKAYVDIFSPSWHLIVPEDTLYLHSSVNEIQQAGFPVIPWTVNLQKDMKRLIHLGVDGIITDYPDSLIGVLDELNLRVR